MSELVDHPVDMHVPQVFTDGGPWAEHDMACAVCHERKAILNLADGTFQPCGACRRDGWRLVNRRRWKSQRN